MRRPKFADPRVRLALAYAFDFEWINKNIMFGSYDRTPFVLPELAADGGGRAEPEELALLEPLRGQVPDEVFGEVFVPPVSDGIGPRPRHAAEGQRASDRRRLQARADAGCSRPTARRSRSSSSTTIHAFEPHHNAYIAGLKLLGIDGNLPRRRRRRSTSDRLKNFDFDMTVSRFSHVRSIPTRASSSSSAPSRPRSLAPTISPASPTRPSTRSLDKVSHRRGSGQLRHRGARARPPAARASTSGCRSGTRRRTGSPTGTCSRGRRQSRSTIRACSTPGGSTPRRPRKSAESG